ncbi:hypothetical protein [Cerasicoccus maritimus]|uniref:hypothetical protein n=1 Tax=Cerasicoccus maritimus TaxID=490089 RepID=UPI0028527FED|nr:hypothetical protein [Cerasicoccus maritimus]
MEDYITHLKASHSNIQETIRFIDQKASIIFGLVVFVLGASLLMYKNQYLLPVSPGSTSIKLSVTPWSVVSGTFLIIAFGFTTLCTTSLYSCLKARGPSSNKELILFPINIKSAVSIKSLYNETKDPTKTEDKVVEEYEDQVYAVGVIMSKKFQYLNRLMTFFAFQASFTGLLFVVVCLHSVYC